MYDLTLLGFSSCSVGDQKGFSREKFFMTHAPAVALSARLSLSKLRSKREAAFLSSITPLVLDDTPTALSSLPSEFAQPLPPTLLSHSYGIVCASYSRPCGGSVASSPKDALCSECNFRNGVQADSTVENSQGMEDYLGRGDGLQSVLGLGKVKVVPGPTSTEENSPPGVPRREAIVSPTLQPTLVSVLTTMSAHAVGSGGMEVVSAGRTSDDYDGFMKIDGPTPTIHTCLSDENPRVRLCFASRHSGNHAEPVSVTSFLFTGTMPGESSQAAGTVSGDDGELQQGVTNEAQWWVDLLDNNVGGFGASGGVMGGIGILSGSSEEISFAPIFTESSAKRPSQQASYRDAYWLDGGTISGEHRKRVIALQSYRSSVLPFVDKKEVKKYLNQEFFLRHPELQPRELKITHIRSIKRTMLQFAMDHGSPLELGTVACAVWYFERLVGKLLVTKTNRKLVVSACLLLGVKFWESGITNNREMGKKLSYALTKCEECLNVAKEKILAAEFRVFAALDFTLMPWGDVVVTHVDRLLLLINVTRVEFYSKHYTPSAIDLD